MSNALLSNPEAGSGDEATRIIPRMFRNLPVPPVIRPAASVVLFPESVDDVGFTASVNTTSCQATLVFRAQDDENLLMAIYIPDGLPAPGTAGGGVWLSGGGW